MTEQAGSGEARDVPVWGHVVRAEAAGSGAPALVLLHGFGASSFTWRHVAPVLAASHLVVTFDRFGFGASARPSVDGRPSPYGEEGALASTLAVMDAWGLDDAVLVGSSAGGALAARIALVHPARVRAAILIGTPVGTPPAVPVTAALLAVPGSSHVARWLFGRVGGLGLFEAGFRRAWADGERLTPEVLARYRDDWFAPGWERANVELPRARQPALGLSEAARIAVPTLVIVGRHDRFVRVRRAEALARSLPSASLCVVDDAGHLPHEEQPAPVLEAIEGFLGSLA